MRLGRFAQTSVARKESPAELCSGSTGGEVDARAYMFAPVIMLL
jgi:hypothetical protein